MASDASESVDGILMAKKQERLVPPKEARETFTANAEPPDMGAANPVVAAAAADGDGRVTFICEMTCSYLTCLIYFVT